MVTRCVCKSRAFIAVGFLLAGYLLTDGGYQKRSSLDILGLENKNTARLGSNYPDTKVMIAIRAPPQSADTQTLVLDEPKEQQASILNQTSNIASLGGNTNLSIAWLATYPNSGTSFTIVLVTKGSNLSSATNYGKEVTPMDRDSLRVFVDQPEGPFYGGLSRNMNELKQLPETSILTKTHCSGGCVRCPLDDKSQSASRFLEACKEATRYDLDPGGGAPHHVLQYYPATHVSRVIHLIRNPLHNIVARYHLDRKHILEDDPAKEVSYPSNAVGFRRWCRELDEHFDKRSFPKAVHLLLSEVPCRAEFYRYTMFHNRHVEMIPLLTKESKFDSIKTMTIHYEDYAINYSSTVDRLFSFLDIPKVGPFHTFRSQSTYDDYYTDNERYAVKMFTKRVATAHTWNLLEHYFIL